MKYSIVSVAVSRSTGSPSSTNMRTAGSLSSASNASTSSGSNWRRIIRSVSRNAFTRPRMTERRAAGSGMPSSDARSAASGDESEQFGAVRAGHRRLVGSGIDLDDASDDAWSAEQLVGCREARQQFGE